MLNQPICKHIGSSLLMFIIIGLCLLSKVQSVAAQCHPSSDFSTMNKNFLNYLNQMRDGSDKDLALMPLYDNSVGRADIPFYSGIPFYIYDTFSDANSHMVHPYVSGAVMQELGLVGRPSIQKANLAEFASKLKVRFVLFGSFQRTYRDTIRVILNIYDTKTQHILSPAESFDVPTNDAFFDVLKTHTEKVFSQAKAARSVKNKKGQTPKMQSFLYLSKGLALADTYDLTRLELASSWLEKALKESFHKYDDAALHLARTYLMMALIQKSQKQDFSVNWQKAQFALKDVSNLAKSTSSKYQMAMRFIKGHEYALQASSTYMAGKKAEAYEAALKVLANVPEDGLAQNMVLVTDQAKSKHKITLNNPICF